MLFDIKSSIMSHTKENVILNTFQNKKIGRYYINKVKQEINSSEDIKTCGQLLNYARKYGVSKLV